MLSIKKDNSCSLPKKSTNKAGHSVRGFDRRETKHTKINMQLKMYDKSKTPDDA